MWVRGLKQHQREKGNAHKPSHPMWVRGLKLFLNMQIPQTLLVAPYVGAWIETPKRVHLHKGVGVAPYVGAWIETCFLI